MKNRIALSLATLLMIASFPTVLSALGLGELHSSSQLNQPLRASIDLLSTSAAQARQLKVRLASADVFRRVGIDRPAYLSSLQFTPTVIRGKPVIRVTSRVPISEPFLNFLLEVSWPQGQLLKEYTVLLDPPVLLQSGNQTVDNSASVRAEPRPATPVQNQRRLAEQRRQQEQNQRQQQQQRQLEQQRKQNVLRQQRQREQATLNEKQRIQREQQSRFESQAMAALKEEPVARKAILNKNTPPTRTNVAKVNTAKPAVAKKKPAVRRTSRSKYRVRRGDTMSKVASKMKHRGVSNSQMIVALFRANPHAFTNGNVNNLKAGVLLSRPSREILGNLSQKKSRKLVTQHVSQWKKLRSGLANNTVAQKNTMVAQPKTEPTPTVTQRPAEVKAPKVNTPAANDQANLKVAGGQGGDKSSTASGSRERVELQQQVLLAREALASSRSEAAELGLRVNKLESIIRKKDRLINLKNERLAKLEAQLSGATRVTKPKDLVNQMANAADQKENKIIRTEETGNLVDDIASAQEKAPSALPVEKAEDSPFRNDAKEKSDDGILSLLSSPLVGAIGGGSLLALLMGWLLMRRSKNNALQDDDFFDDDFDENAVDPVDEYIDEGIDSDPVTASDQSIDDDFGDLSAGDESEEGFDKLLASEDNQDNQDDDDIVQEADVYIVYGLYDQAEDELRKAIKANPEKMAYHHKLLETYKVSGNKDAFITTAQEFLEAKGENKDKYWESIAQWGSKLAPDEKMFGHSTAKAAMLALGGGVGAGAATVLAKEAFSTEKQEDFGTELKDTEPYGLDADIDETLVFDPKAVGETVNTDDFSLDLDDDLDFDLDSKLETTLDNKPKIADKKVDEMFDLGDLTLGMDDPLKDVKTKADDTKNILNFEKSESDLFSNNNLDLSKQPVTDNTNNAVSAEDSIDDALSFLDLSEDIDDSQENISTKLDLARAYLDMGDIEGARNTLEEVVIEGNDDQKRQAETLLQETG
ncbi:MAG: hypothetical protein KAH22_07100 [Thiotrichaceae bacterium]|nr:hypothetical protein [Thiotrichaceae bacterium]